MLTNTWFSYKKNPKSRSFSQRGEKNKIIQYFFLTPMADFVACCIKHKRNQFVIFFQDKTKYISQDCLLSKRMLIYNIFTRK